MEIGETPQPAAGRIVERVRDRIRRLIAGIDGARVAVSERRRRAGDAAAGGIAAFGAVTELPVITMERGSR